MVRSENAVVRPLKPTFYKRYVDDIFAKRKKNVPDVLFNELNNYHPKINLTIEVNPSKFLDSKINVDKQGNITTEVFRKETKLPVPWKSKSPKRYKRNALLGDLHRAYRISSNFNREITLIFEKFLKAGYPRRFIHSVVNDFKRSINKNKDDEMIIPPGFFEEKKPFLLIELPYCEENELKAKHFIKKFHVFTNSKYDVAIKWITRKVKSLFVLKDRTLYPSCKVYKGECSCGESYVGETLRNVAVRWSEHNNIKNTSEPAKHLFQNPSHTFNWSVLISSPKDTRTRKNLEAFFIAKEQPSLNEQVLHNVLNLFRNGVT